ncbi:MAG: hypothetical protein U1F25_00075 [Rubrivivax sp.]
MQRPDDNEATVARRLEVYDAQTRPLIDHYRAQGLLHTINAAREAVTAELVAPVLETLGGTAELPVLAPANNAASQRPGRQPGQWPRSGAPGGQLGCGEAPEGEAPGEASAGADDGVGEEEARRAQASAASKPVAKRPARKAAARKASPKKASAKKAAARRSVRRRRS